MTSLPVIRPVYPPEPYSTRLRIRHVKKFVKEIGDLKARGKLSKLVSSEVAANVPYLQAACMKHCGNELPRVVPEDNLRLMAATYSQFRSFDFFVPLCLANLCPRQLLASTPKLCMETKKFMRRMSSRSAGAMACQTMETYVRREFSDLGRLHGNY